MLVKVCKKPEKVEDNFSKLFDYITDDQGNPHRMGESWTNNCSDDLKTAETEIKLTQALNKRAKIKTYHYVISFDNDEIASEEQMKEIEKRYAESIGFKDHQRICVVHRDTDHTHIHVAVNKINPETFKSLTPYNDYIKLLNQSRKMTREYFGHDLRISENNVKNYLSGDHDFIDISTKNQNQKVSTKAQDFEAKYGLDSFERFLKERILEIKSKDTWRELHKYLNSQGIFLVKRANGLVFKTYLDRGETGIQKVSTFKNNLPMLFCKASSIDRSFSLKNLEKKLGKFEEFKFTNISKQNESYQAKLRPHIEIQSYDNFMSLRKDNFTRINNDFEESMKNSYAMQKTINQVINLTLDKEDEELRKILYYLNKMFSEFDRALIKEESQQRKRNLGTYKGYLKDLKISKKPKRFNRSGQLYKYFNLKIKSLDDEKRVDNYEELIEKYYQGKSLYEKLPEEKKQRMSFEYLDQFTENQNQKEQENKNQDLIQKEKKNARKGSIKK